MKRKTFLLQGSILSAAGVLMLGNNSFSKALLNTNNKEAENTLYQLFKDPANNYRPFVRWWWNGNKIEKAELARELRFQKTGDVVGLI